MKLSKKLQIQSLVNRCKKLEEDSVILAGLPASKERAKQFVTVETQYEAEEEEPQATERPQTPQNEEPSVLEPMEKTPEKSDELLNQVTSSTNVSSSKICPPSSSIQVVPPTQPAGGLRYVNFAHFSSFLLSRMESSSPLKRLLPPGGWSYDWWLNWNGTEARRQADPCYNWFQVSYLSKDLSHWTRRSKACKIIAFKDILLLAVWSNFQ